MKCSVIRKPVSSMLSGFAYALDGLILFYLGFSVLEKETVSMNHFLEYEIIVLVLLDF